MKNFLCWRPDGVTEVINPEAEVVSPAIFRAVHSSCDLQVSGRIGTVFQDIKPEHYRSMSQEALLADFLAPNVPYRRMAVFGRSGSGKSHLIHWLKLHIPSTEARRVVVVPKTGTSLRSILEMLIDELPEDQQASFRQDLDRTGQSIATRHGQKKRLLNELAFALGERQPRPDSPDPDLERELIKVLPHLLEDVHFRDKYFFQDGNIIADLVDHVFAAPTAYRPVDQRRSFKLEDLPVDVLDLKDAAALARNALQYLHGVPSAPQLAVDLINASLDAALANALSFTGDRLVGLMDEVRRHLKNRGRELVLLIEDFARIQGLDRALLQAMIEQGAQDDLCRFRWAIAVTTGFFEQVIDTVYTRIDYFVNMDRSSGRRTQGRLEPQALSEFAGPYLNAARLGADRLREQDDEGAEARPLNACENCEHRLVCHATFGTDRQGYGLYPFTPKALWNMANRVDDNVEEAFNPRTLQTGVLIPTLEEGGPVLAVGAFPPAALLNRLGGYRGLDATARRDLRQRTGPEEGRLGALLELWDGSGKLINLPQPLLEAFSAPSIPDAAEAIIEDEDEPRPGTPRPAATPSVDIRSQEERELEAWAKGGTLDRALNRLRPLIFDSIADGIDWDALGLERSRFCAAEDVRAFRRRSINFVRQGVSVTPSLVMLTIPAKDAPAAEFDRVAVALSGLLRANREGHWDFPGGTRALGEFLGLLAEWQAEVVAQLQALVAPLPGWDHVSAACELLALGCAINGRIKSEADLTADIAALMAPDWPSEVAANSPQIQKLYQSLHGSQAELRRTVRSLCSAGKGGEVGALINPTRLRLALKQLRANGWRLTQTPPQDLKFEPFRKCADLYGKIATALPEAAEAERSLRVGWLQDMEAAFGEAKRATIISGLEEVMEAFKDAGLAGASATRLAQALDEFGRTNFDDAIGAARALQANPDALMVLPAFARGRAGAIAAARKLVETASGFLDGSAQHLAEQASKHSAQEQAVADDMSTIAGSLEQIAEGLGTLEVADAA